MTNVVMLYKKEQLMNNLPSDPVIQNAVQKKQTRSFLSGFLSLIKILLVFCWPIIRWFIYFDLIIVFLKMMLHTHKHATLVFVAHSGVFLFVLIFMIFFNLGSTIKQI